MDNGLRKASIEKIAAGGAGLARIDGKAAFIEGSAAGETVLCRITKEHRSWVQAELAEIVGPSPDRVPPACGLYGKCGGCNFQHLVYEAQIAAKTAILEEAFARIGNFRPPRPLVFPSNPWEYRNRMQFHSATDGSWGLKARKNSEIVPINDCPIADPGIQALLKAPPASPMQERFAVYARDGLFLSENGIRQGKTSVLGRELALDIGAFFQSNGAMLEKLIAGLLEIAAAADRSLPMADLYCGVGTFAAFLGGLFPHVDLVEESKNALALARKNLAPHKSADFFAQSSGDWAKNALPRSYGFICADPPRQGLDPDLARRLAADGPPLLAYVSCDPATLARDSKVLLKGGYGLKELRLYDFYPQTAHIESLALFARP